ncbi:hypothetical protein D3C71_2114780 [compost metagenome]
MWLGAVLLRAHKGFDVEFGPYDEPIAGDLHGPASACDTRLAMATDRVDCAVLESLQSRRKSLATDRVGYDALKRPAP